MNSLLRFVASQHSTELNAVRVTFKYAELIVMGSLGGIQDKLGAELDAREKSHGGLSEAAHYEERCRVWIQVISIILPHWGMLEPDRK